jgi:hypothetical protein
LNQKGNFLFKAEKVGGDIVPAKRCRIRAVILKNIKENKNSNNFAHRFFGTIICELYGEVILKFPCV